MTLSIIPIQNLNNSYPSFTKNKAKNHFITQPLQQDTVSINNPKKQNNVAFTGNPGTTIADFLAEGVSKNAERYGRIAMTYLDVLESVANKLKDEGVSFDRAYCEQNPVKSPVSYVSKIIRSKNLKVPDTIRATLYVNDPYNMDTLCELLAEMKKRGYVVPDTEVKISELVKRGYIPTEAESKNLSKEVMIPDLDLRLDHIDGDIAKLPQRFRYSMSKPQKSGYEDIQMRFIRSFAKATDKKNEAPIQHELIILFGPESSKAKHEESEKVYSHLRKFGELAMKFDTSQAGTHSQKAARYIDLIEGMFRGKISQKLFANAKNKDVYELNERIPIEFNETDLNMFENYFSGLKDRIQSCYNEEKKLATTSNEKNALQRDYRHDKTIIDNIHENLRKTIEYFNETPVKKKTTNKK